MDKIVETPEAKETKEVAGLHDWLEQAMKPEQPKQNDCISETDRRQMDKQADYIVGVIGKNGDFYTGLKREQIHDAFDKATEKGKTHLDYLVDKINEKLKKTNPDLKVEADFKVLKNWYVDKPSPEEAHLMVYRPSKPTEKEEFASVIKIKNILSGEDEDRFGCLPPDRPGYIKVPPPRVLLDLESLLRPSDTKRKEPEKSFPQIEKEPLKPNPYIDAPLRPPLKRNPYIDPDRP